MARCVVEMNQKSPIIGKGYLALGIGCCCKASTGEFNIQCSGVANNWVGDVFIYMVFTNL